MYSSKALYLSLAFVLQCSALPNVRRQDPTASQNDFDELQRAADLSSAAYSACQNQAFDVTITMQIDDHVTGTQGFIGYSDSLQRITLSMRGSTSPLDFANDLNIIPTTPSLSGVNFPDGTEVMEGVYGPWSSVHDQVIGEFQRLIGLYPGYSLESTGHSLGGSLTYLSYIALAQNFPGISITSNALNAFPIGNDVFADFGSSQAGTIRRGTEQGDGVPNMYTDIYSHYGTEYYTDGSAAGTIVCNGERDTSCSAGDGAFTVTPEHVESFGVVMLLAGCGS